MVADEVWLAMVAAETKAISKLIEVTVADTSRYLQP